jgi:hypothetical protein
MILTQHKEMDPLKNSIPYNWAVETSLSPKMFRDSQKMKVLVTGATGFIGSHVVRLAAKEGHEVYVALQKVGLTHIGLRIFCHSSNLSLEICRQTKS